MQKRSSTLRLYVDSASLDEIREWAQHSWVSGFTTNPSLVRKDSGYGPGFTRDWAKYAVEAAAGKPISIDGPPEIWELGPNVYRKVIGKDFSLAGPVNLTAICTTEQTMVKGLRSTDIISVFAGRIMDTGRNPQLVIEAACAIGAQVLWASVRESYNIIQAERAGCDIITVPPAILRKYLDWHGKPLEVVAEETIAQFDRDREGLW